jgi:chromosome partitioning protein
MKQSIISVVSFKGGVGKTTIACNLALGFSGMPGLPSVALVDADPQQSSIETLHGHGLGNLALYESGEDSHNLLRGLKERIVICDTPPQGSNVTIRCAALSHLVVIPTQPSPIDLRALKKTVDALIGLKGKFVPGLRCRFLINRVSGNTTLGKDIRGAIERLYPVFPVFDAQLHDREAYKQSLIDGRSVLALGQSNPAAKEMAQLQLEIGIILKL